MPVTSLSTVPDRFSKNSLHRKNNSGELAVFEAARYFSSAGDNHPENGALFSQAFETRRQARKNPAHRLSLDMPINIALQTPKEKPKKPNKNPSSPGSKLISTLINSIFNQSGSRKKKKSKSGDKTGQFPGEGRKRRSSTSNFGMNATNTNYESESTAKTPTKSSFRDLLLRKFPVSRPGNSVSPGLTYCQDEKNSRFSNVNSGVSSGTIWGEDDDGNGDSDSSSDLFDLPMISDELDFSSSGLPVYGTTQISSVFL